MITVTDAAAARLCVLLERSGASGVRVTVQSAGCDGFAALMDLGEPAPGDVEIADNGVILYVDVASALKIPGATLDHRTTPHGSEFAWSHPASERGCTCEDELHGDA